MNKWSPWAHLSDSPADGLSTIPVEVVEFQDFRVPVPSKDSTSVSARFVGVYQSLSFN